MMMYNPPHPGRIIKDTCLDPLNLSVTEAAKALQVSRVALSRVLNGKAGISADLAYRLELAGFSKARLWLDLQSDYNLWHAMQKPVPQVRRLWEPPVFDTEAGEDAAA